MRIPLKVLLLCLCATIAGRDLTSQSSVVYVDVNLGSDNNSGTRTQPFQTIQHGINQVVSGGTVNVLFGFYPESLTINKNVKLEGLPRAILQPPAGPNEAIAIFPTTEAITAETRVRSMELRNPNSVPIGLHIHSDPTGSFAGDLSPTIELNEIDGFATGILVDASDFASVSEPLIRFNEIRGNLACIEPGSTGILLQARDDGFLLPNVRSNKVRWQSVGIDMQILNSGFIRASLLCNGVLHYDIGIRIDQDVLADIAHQSISGSLASNNANTVYGIENFSDFSHVYNSILWTVLPSDCGGNPLPGQDIMDHTARPDFIDTYSIVYDWNPTADPMFTGDLWLQSGSAAIDAANTALVAPGGALPVDYDRRGGPRIIASNGIGPANADLGAYEFTPFFTRVNATYPSHDASYDAIVNEPLGSVFTFRVNTFLNGLPIYHFVFWLHPRVPDYNLLWPSVGNQLLPFLAPSTFSFHGVNSISIPVTVPMDLGLVEQEWEMQGLLFFTSVPDLNQGAFTRKVLLQLNE